MGGAFCFWGVRFWTSWELAVSFVASARRRKAKIYRFMEPPE
jgi:hypothetical protein